MQLGSRAALAGAIIAMAAFAGAGHAAPASAVRLGPLLRVQSPGGSPIACPYESEPEIATTTAGTWVAYNDDSGCPLIASKPHFTSVQLLPAGGGPARPVTLPSLPGQDSWFGDPDLAPDPAGDGVLLSTLRFVSEAPVTNNVGGIRLEILRITPDLRVQVLPSPTVSGSDDKEYLATDTGARSRYRGRTYVAWDDLGTGKVTVRAFDGRRWLRPATVGDITAEPDVAVAPNGDVAVAYSTDAGIAVRVSTDGGASFSAATTALKGRGPGRDDPSCPLRPTIAQRQRANKSPHVAWDRRGRLHVVAALSTSGGPEIATSSAGVVTGGEGSILHAVSTDRAASFSHQQLVGSAETAEVQWAPAIAALPDGGVAVSYLQTADTTSYDALVAVEPGGASRFRAPVLLSDGHGPLPAATEAVGNSNCYGIGDYTGLAPTADGVVADWPTTVAVQTSYVDSDIAVRQVHTAR